MPYSVFLLNPPCFRQIYRLKPVKYILPQMPQINIRVKYILLIHLYQKNIFKKDYEAWIFNKKALNGLRQDAEYMKYFE